jgi:hypothetical protein
MNAIKPACVGTVTDVEWALSLRGLPGYGPGEGSAFIPLAVDFQAGA